MEVAPPTQLARATIDNWSVAESGLNTRAVNCLDQDGVKTIGQLRGRSDEELLNLTNFGPLSLDNVHWFFSWTQRIQSGDADMPDFRALLREFLNPQEIFVLEHRYGLTDPLFRPQMKRCTLQEIGESRRVTRERMRQVEESALTALRSRLVRTVAAYQEFYWVNRILSHGGVVTFAELSEWTGDARLGGYQPWGVLLLLSDVLEQITCRHDYFTVVRSHTLDQVENEFLELLRDANEPVALEKILARVAGALNSAKGQRRELVMKLLDHHPEISGTLDRHYFLPWIGARHFIRDILRHRPEPSHFHELTRLYNDRMLPHSRKGTGYILIVLTAMADVQRISRGKYSLKD